MSLHHISPGLRMSKAVIIGDIVFLAGQVPTDLEADIETQTSQVLSGIDNVMAELGGSKSDVASVQVWLADIDDIQKMNKVWDAWIDPAFPPARATCGVKLARTGMRVEMIAVARLPKTI